MTAQDHIDAIGAKQVELEVQTRQLRKLSKDIVQTVRELHALEDAAQQAYIDAHANDGNVVAFSGGHDKNPPTNPDEPVEP